MHKAPPYFNSAPVLNATVTLDFGSQSLANKGVQIPTGRSKTIDVQLFSDKAMGNWTLQATDETYGTGQPAQLKFAWDNDSGHNGDTRHLTITRLADGSHNGTEFMVWSMWGATNIHTWFGFVAN